MIELVFDIGNTRTKWASFVNGALTEHGKFPNEDPLPLLIREMDPTTNVLICSVSKKTKRAIWILEKFEKVLEFNSETPTPVRSEYKTPTTLGMDRSANAVAAKIIYPEQNILIIDVGTCITVDLVSSDGVHKGGTIAPGLQMRLMALNNYTDALPLVQLAEAKKYLGQTTDQSILSGVLNGAIAEMNGCIEHIQKEYPHLKVVVTGGDMKWFEHVLKSETFADAFFTLKGLHAILQYNS